MKNVNVIRYNYDTKVFSTIEVRLFADPNDNDKPKNGKKWKVKENNGQVPNNLMNGYRGVNKGTWKKFKEWCQRNNLTPDPNSGGYGGGGGNNSQRNDEGSYGRTDASGNTRNEGPKDLYTRHNPFRTEPEIGKMNARKYATIRLLKERLNELMNEGLILDVREDGNHNYVCRIPRHNSAGHPSLTANYVYIGIYVIDDNLFGLVKWDMDGGGAVRDAVKNAAIAGPENLRQIIRKIVNNEKDLWTQLRSNTWNLAPNIIEYFAHLVTITCKWAYGLFKKWWHGFGKSVGMDY